MSRHYIYKAKKTIIGIKDCSLVEWASQQDCCNEIKRSRETIRMAIKTGKMCVGYNLYYK